MMRDSYDWSDMDPNTFRGEKFNAVGSMRLPHKKMRKDGSVYANDMPVPSLVVDVYSVGSANRSDNGAQADFFQNNADTECADEFAIKVFGSFHEAYCAYNRQYMAAREDMAPPVGRMVLFSYLKRTRRVSLSNLQLGDDESRVYRWGYQTAVAVMGECRDETEEAYELADEAWNEYIEEQRGEIFVPDCFEEHDHEPCEHARENFVDEWVQDYRAEQPNPKEEIECHNWAIDYEMLPTEAELALAIRDEDFEFKADGETLTVAKFLRRMNGSWNPTWGIALVEYLRANTEHCCQEAHQALNGEPTGDLHNQNFGLWNDDPVIIDWGYHILGGGANHPAHEIMKDVPEVDWGYERAYRDEWFRKAPVVIL